MLDNDYSTQFRQVIDSVDWQIELPSQWKGYFQERGEVPSFPQDDRFNQRLKARAHGLLWFEQALPMRPRTGDPIGVYSKDFSRNGVGFLSSMELFPEEYVRLVLPTFWVQLRVMRARKMTDHCYEIGAILVGRHDPCSEAFGNVRDQLASC